MKRKTVLIIGAGVSGLAAGIYAEMNGLHAVILEKNPSVGGLCTGWYRKGQYIDGCIHWLTGTKKGNDLYKMWTDVGVIDKDVPILQLEGWGTFDYQGIKVPFYSDLDKAEQEWLKISPEDKKHIRHFFKMVRDIASVNLPLEKAVADLSLGRMSKFLLELLSVWPSYLLTMKMSCEKYAKRFKSPALRWAITHAQPGDGNLYSMLFSYANVAIGNGGIPMGGSKPMVERMKERFISLGGTLKLNTSVSHVIVEKSKCLGVKLDSGENIYADYTISALDINYAINRLLLNQYPIPKYDKRFFNMKKHPAPSCCLIAFRGVNSDISTPYSFECEPFTVGGTTISHITIRNYNYDEETYVKDGKVLYTVLLDQYSINYDYWKRLYNTDRKEYNRRKNDLATAVRGRIIQKFPFFKDNLEVLDVFTPKTLNRYTNASRGAYMGFLFTPRSGRLTTSGVVKGLDNFYLAGQWCQCPGGLPLALASGNYAIQKIMKKEKLLTLVSSVKVLSNKNAN